VLEALLKRVDGLEKRLQDENKSGTSPTNESTAALVEEVRNATAQAQQAQQAQLAAQAQAQAQTPKLKTTVGSSTEFNFNAPPEQTYSPLEPRGHAVEMHPLPSQPPQSNYEEAFFEAYLTHGHGKPYHIVDDGSIRQRYRQSKEATPLMLSIFAVGARYDHAYSSNLCLLADNSRYVFPGAAGANLSEDFALRARKDIDMDEPTVESVQSLLLLSDAFFGLGRGRKSYMLLSKSSHNVLLLTC
jgi:hypothetical protein